jgi:hypothetical protein
MAKTHSGWRPEDDAELPDGWTWKSTCYQCNGPMPTKPSDEFCTDECKREYHGQIDAVADGDGE